MNHRLSRRSAGRLAGCPCCSIVPPYLLEHLAEHGSERIRRCARRSQLETARLRGQRDLLAQLGAVAVTTPTGGKTRTVYDAKHGTKLPGQQVRAEGEARSKDRSVNEAYDYAGATYDFFRTIFSRNSIDDRGMRLDASVHYSTDYDNAFWNGLQMVYGDGDGALFERFTKCLDVVGHELTHGVTQFEAGLEYQDQPGALNESMSDVFGTLVKQWKLKQDATEADWLIGAGLFTKQVNGVALRSLKAPGTAYDDPQIGRDPQPAHMKDLYHGKDDNGGVHINSGIPNHAFYLAATTLGGNAWDEAGRIWYEALTTRLRPTSDFAAAAKATIDAARQLYGSTSEEQAAVTDAWAAVGVT